MIQKPEWLLETFVIGREREGGGVTVRGLTMQREANSKVKLSIAAQWSVMSAVSYPCTVHSPVLGKMSLKVMSLSLYEIYSKDFLDLLPAFQENQKVLVKISRNLDR